MTRKLFIRSEPAGAQVLLDGRLVGTTPYQEEFQSYGVRRLELRSAGFRRRIEEIDVSRPWWQMLPFSLVTDLLLPVDLQDDHVFDFALSPLVGSLDAASAETAARAAYARLQAIRDGTAGGSGDP